MLDLTVCLDSGLAKPLYQQLYESLSRPDPLRPPPARG